MTPPTTGPRRRAVVEDEFRSDATIVLDGSRRKGLSVAARRVPWPIPRVEANESSNEHADTSPDCLDQLDGPSRERPAQRYQGLRADTCWTGSK